MTERQPTLRLSRRRVIKKKNYLFKSLFRVKSTNWLISNRDREKDLFENYMSMHEISTASFQKFLSGEWELKFITGEVDQINDAFEQTFWAIHDLWHREPCNILYTDPDTIATKSIDIWDRYDQFRMFNFTAPNSYGKFANYFNAGVRYFASTMDRAIWQTGADMARKWNKGDYNTEQIILNTMLWDQGLTLKEVLDPVMAWQGSGLNNRQCKMEDACILHLHSSRGAKNRLQEMTRLAKSIGLDT